MPNSSEIRHPYLRNLSDFFKDYAVFLTLVTALPLYSGALNVLEPPKDSAKLSVISGLFSMVSLGICILIGPELARWRESSSAFMRARPILLTLAAFAISFTAMACYGNDGQKKVVQSSLNSQAEISAPVENPQTFTATAPNPTVNAAPKPDQFAAIIAAISKRLVEIGQSSLYDKICYLTIFPALVFGFGTLCLVTLQHISGIDHDIWVQQGIHETARHQLSKITKSLIRFAAIVIPEKETTDLKLIGTKMLADLELETQELARGKLTACGSRILQIQKLLFTHTDESFFAVSNCDLDFWMVSQRDLSKPLEEFLGHQYWLLNVRAARDGRKVSRIFIVSQADLETRREFLRTILSRHSEYGIAWALIRSDTLSAIEQPGDAKLDFALFDYASGNPAVNSADSAKLVSFFSTGQEEERSLEVLFGFPNNAALLQTQIGLHKQLVSLCTVMNQKFADYHLAHNGSGHKGVVSNKEIGGALELLVKEGRNSFKDLFCDLPPAFRLWEGRWKYRVCFPNDQTGHAGICEFVDFGRGRLEIRGTRKLTYDMLGRRIRTDSTWKSSSVELDESHVKFMYEIDVNNEVIGGYCNCDATVENGVINQIDGSIFLRKPRNLTTDGHIKFERYAEENPNLEPFLDSLAVELERAKDIAEMEAALIKNEQAYLSNPGKGEAYRLIRQRLSQNKMQYWASAEELQLLKEEIAQLDANLA